MKAYFDDKLYTKQNKFSLTIVENLNCLPSRIVSDILIMIIIALHAGSHFLIR